MALRLNVLTVFLLILLASTVSAKDETPGEKDRFGHPKAKSVRMCEEYGRQSSVDTSVISPLTSNPTAITLNTTTCMPVNRLVVGGVTATPNEFPHMVAMGKKTDEGFKIACGASLIAPEWILTAAHCTHGGSTDILIGYHDLRNTKGGISTTINETVRHPEYKPPSLYNDIALIKLNKVIQFNNRIKPACLYETYERVPAKAWISGWGNLEFLGESSNTLQKAELEIIDNIKCALRHTDSLRLPNGITPDMICAGAPSEKWSKDTCQGDSGGPLQIIHPNNNCLFQLVGVTSFGLGCAFDNMPAVYTKVSHYINWIEDIVWPTA
ncbi:serine protease snk isoform X2 [Nomia melanderi]|uniref:serine protease snk isoform X2 n=1 Tax=Nomia melanderi TaxID=2448451 RepID=UPI0013043F04|nr:serine protease snake-like isoform X2 [Nomia melanderi]XP_031842856.1 serine protease snake-like isoform X2 [Nomia melanderi]